MHLKEYMIALVGLVLLQVLGFPVAGLLTLFGMLAVVLAGLLLVIGAEAEAGRAFVGGIAAVALSLALSAAGASAHGRVPGELPNLLPGLVCLAIPLMSLGGLHLLARGLASLPDRPRPERPLEWRRAEVIEPEEPARRPRQRTGAGDDLDIFGRRR